MARVYPAIVLLNGSLSGSATVLEVARILKRRLAVAVAVTALLAGGTAVALGATGSASHGRRHTGHSRAAAHQTSTPLTVAAGYLGISAAQLRRELRSGKSLAQVADSTPGRSAAGLVAALLSTGKARLQQRVTELVNRPGGVHAARAGARARRGRIRAAALSYLGLTREQLARELHSGKTLGQVADATAGKSSAGLVEAIVTAAGRRLDAAVGAGNLSRSAETARLASLRARATALVNHSHPGKTSH